VRRSSRRKQARRLGASHERERIDTPAFIKALDLASAAAQPVCIAGTAFALVALLDDLAEMERLH